MQVTYVTHNEILRKKTRLGKLQLIIETTEELKNDKNQKTEKIIFNLSF